MFGEKVRSRQNLKVAKALDGQRYALPVYVGVSGAATPKGLIIYADFI